MRPPYTQSRTLHSEGQRRPFQLRCHFAVVRPFKEESIPARDFATHIAVKTSHPQNVKELKKGQVQKTLRKKTCPCSPNVKSNYAANIRQKTSIDDKSQKKILNC